MKTITEDDYEEMAAAFQCFQIQALYQSLKDNGVEDSKIRKICEEFTHSVGVTLDQHWIESEAGKVFPIVGFTKIHSDYQPPEVFLNNGMFSFAEYASGNISWFFDENSPADSPQKSGQVGDDGQPA
jgi:hypothetical protein